MGEVLVALHEPTGRQVALKVALGDPSPDERARFVREAQATAALHHPNIVVIHDAGEINGRAFLAMELVQGQSLKSHVETAGPVPSRDAAALVRSLADAISVAHGCGVLHRDLKPANVLLTPEGLVKLVDFGLARRASDQSLTQTGQVLGTPAYMPPEQAAGERERIDERSDVYGLGAILYTLLCGEPPFAGATAINIVAKVLSKPPEPPSKRHPGVDQDLEAICLRALEKEPEDRYGSAGEFGRALTHYLDGSEARRPSPNVLAVAALVVIVLAALGGWMGAKQGGGDTRPEVPTPPIREDVPVRRVVLDSKTFGTSTPWSSPEGGRSPLRSEASDCGAPRSYAKGPASVFRCSSTERRFMSTWTWPLTSCMERSTPGTSWRCGSKGRTARGYSNSRSGSGSARIGFSSSLRLG
jgi:serine/threonine-protein kinase